MKRFMRSVVTATSMAITLMVAQAAAAAPSLQLIDLGTLGGSYSVAIDLNAHGQVVGTSGLAAGGSHAFLWENGTLTDLGTLGGDSLAVAVNEGGQVIGRSMTGSGEHAFLWEDGQMTSLGVLEPEDRYSRALAVNDAGTRTVGLERAVLVARHDHTFSRVNEV